jgi:sigma-B regulation protein RsbU (phosphoserine phosphatase)
MTATENSMKGDSKLRLIEKINRRITASVDFDEVLPLILDSVAEVVACDFVAIHLVDPDDQSLHVIASRGSRRTPQVELPLEVFQLPPWRSVSLVEGPHSDSEKIAYVADSAGSGNQLALPIVSGDKIVGVLSLENHHPSDLLEEILEWLSVLATQAALFIDKALLHAELIEKKRLEEELRIARDVQLSLLPSSAPTLNGLDIHGINVPTYSVGGDYYDFIPIVDGHLGIVVADVAGKGIPASLIMASFRAVLRAEIRNNYAIRTILTKVNRLLYETLRDDQFVSAFYGVLDLARRRFTYSNAGHHPGIVFRPDGKRRYLKSGGMVLGIFDGVSYNEQFIDLVPGDLLLLYTDGLVEADNRDGEMYGRSRLEKFVADNKGMDSRALCDALYADVSTFTDAARPSDDTTIVIAKIL